MSTNYGNPVQILKRNNADKTYSFDLKLLESTIRLSNARDANISVISITGAFRKGKSFLLNFCLRYLNETYVNNRQDWLGGNDTVLDGFSWRGGSERNTTGIWIWSKIFTKILPSGEKIGVMLMDTQGTFDSNSTMQDNVTVFSLATMLSSVQIYNLFHNIQEDDLQHLQLFTEYGKLAKQQNTDDKPFQELLFLIRDWNFPYEAPYGYVGGRTILERVLRVNDDQPNEIRSIREHLKSCYDKLDCYLLPYPGQTAVTSREFNGKLSDLDADFITSLQDFMPSILAPENVRVKKINGVKVNGKYMVTFFESYWSIFKNGGAQTAETILSATTKANLITSKRHAIDYYQIEMQKITASQNPFIEFNEIIGIHNRIKKESLSLFKSKPLMGPADQILRYEQKLESDLNTLFVLYSSANESKRTQNLTQIISTLEQETRDYEAQTNENGDLIGKLKENLTDIKESDESEKEALRNEIEKLKQQQQETIIIDDPEPTPTVWDKINTHLESFGDDLGTAGKTIEGVVGNIGNEIGNFGRDVGAGAERIGEDIVKEAENIGQNIKNEVENIGQNISNTAEDVVHVFQQIELPRIEIPRIELPRFEPPSGGCLMM